MALSPVSALNLNSKFSVFGIAGDLRSNPSGPGLMACGCLSQKAAPAPSAGESDWRGHLV